jgi:diaminopimelate epimerase
MNAASRLRFSKMHGAGNDFVILDCRAPHPAFEPALAPRLADRHRGVGCDQILTIETPLGADAIAAYGIWNADGSRAQQCGNGARCVAAWLRRDGSASGDHFGLESPAGPVEARLLAEGRVAIGMGVPDFTAAGIGLRDADAGDVADPFAFELDGERIELGLVSMGNPHAVLERHDIGALEIAPLATRLQAHPRFARSCNVGFVEVLARDRVRLRVYERGAGETLACGSGACAAVAVLARRGRVAREVAVELPGGTLTIAWPGAAHPLWMTGPAAFVFEGEFIA